LKNKQQDDEPSKPDQYLTELNNRIAQKGTDNTQYVVFEMLVFFINKNLL